MERLKALQSADGSVAQSFLYDQEAGSTHGYSNNQRAYALDGGVEQSFTYGEAGGALSGLDTTVWTGGAPRMGPPRPSPRPSAMTLMASVPPPRWTAGRFAPRSMTPLAYPPTIFYLGATFGVEIPVASANYNHTDWTLTQLAWTGATSTFTYDGDQARLKTMTHTNASGSPLAWTYQYDDANRLTQDGRTATATTPCAG